MDHNPMFLIVLFVLGLLSSHLVCGLTDPFRVLKGQSYSVNIGGTNITSGGVGFIHTGAYLGYKNLNFAKTSVALKLRVSFFNVVISGRRILLRLDSPTATPFLIYDNFYPTLKWNDVITVTQLIPVDKQPKGVHDLYLTFEATNPEDYIVDLYWFTFIASGAYRPEKNALLPTLCVNKETINYSSNQITNCTTVQCTTCTAIDQ